MKYDLATNFDDELIKKAGELGVVKSVYGKLPTDIIGGGRQSMITPNIGKKQLRNHIGICHDQGIEFDYLFNASCLDNRELIGGSHKEIIAYIREIKNQGVDSVTVSNIPLLGMIKEQFPDLGITTSVYMKPDTIEEVLELEKMGANSITLYHNFTRDFPKLEKVAKAVKPETELRLIANNTCIKSCPYMVPGHANFSAHASQKGHLSKEFALDIFPILCGIKKLENLEEVLMSEWIRPEDVPRYEKVGENITLKLTERARKTDWLLRTITAYAEQKYEGNLADILNWIDGNYQQKRIGKMVLGALRGNARLTELLKMKESAFLPPIHIDNRKLDGFLEHFEKSPCADKLCFSRSPENYDCDYCKRTAKKAVKIDEEKRQRNLEEKRETLNKILSGRMFRK